MTAFAAFSLEVLSPLHLGSRRAGVVAQTHRHAPGHLFVHALAAAAGMRRGTSADFFAAALEEIMRRFRFGPAFFMEGNRRLDDAEVEHRLVSSSHHVTLDNSSRSAVDSALFEVEFIRADRGIRLNGGVWFEESDKLDERPLRDWLSDIRLGGEQKIGMGRVRCDGWQDGSNIYPGVGPATSRGVALKAGERLPGASIDGVCEAPLLPWLGRRHDPLNGFGRKLSQASLVRMNGTAKSCSNFLPSNRHADNGCWMIER